MVTASLPNGSEIEFLDEAPADPLRGTLESFRPLDQGRPYFTINGSEADGWTLMLYRWDGYIHDETKEWTERHPPAVTAYWRQPKEFSKFSDLLAELLTHEEVRP